MSTEPIPYTNRMRGYLQFVAAVFYFFLARSLARHSALSVTDLWSPLAGQAILAFLLLFGYAAMGFWFQRQNQPISEQGFPRRESWLGELGTGVALGWAIAVACVLPLVVVGGIAVSISASLSYGGWFLADLAFFAFVALVEEIAFRGYGFQRFMDAVGPVGAVLGFSIFYALVQAFIPGSSHASFAVSIALSVLLSTAYIRTRALWISWGLNFGWKASRALLFGLAVNGVNTHSPIVQGDPMGPFWLTGGGFGLDGTWVTFLLLLLALPVLYRVTSNLNYRHNAPVLLPRGIAVDLDAAARAQHDAAMASAGPAEPPSSALVQIAPVAAPPQASQPTPGSPETSG